MRIKGPLWIHCSTHTAGWSVSAAYLCSSTHTHTHSYSWDVRGHALKVQWSGVFSGLNGPCPPLPSPSLPAAITWPLTHTYLSLSFRFWLKIFIKALKRSSVSKPTSCLDVSCLHRQLPFKWNASSSDWSETLHSWFWCISRKIQHTQILGTFLLEWNRRISSSSSQWMNGFYCSILCLYLWLCI